MITITRRGGGAAAAATGWLGAGRGAVAAGAAREASARRRGRTTRWRSTRPRGCDWQPPGGALRGRRRRETATFGRRRRRVALERRTARECGRSSREIGVSHLRGGRGRSCPSRGHCCRRRHRSATSPDRCCRRHRRRRHRGRRRPATCSWWSAGCRSCSASCRALVLGAVFGVVFGVVLVVVSSTMIVCTSSGVVERRRLGRVDRAELADAGVVVGQAEQPDARRRGRRRRRSRSARRRRPWRASSVDP